MLQRTRSAAPSAARGAFALNRRCCLTGGVENPCMYTANRFLRSQDPCGLNGTCTQLTTRNPAVPHQFEYVCECDPGYTGSKCNKCEHGLTWRSGCRGVCLNDLSVYSSAASASLWITCRRCDHLDCTVMCDSLQTRDESPSLQSTLNFSPGVALER